MPRKIDLALMVVLPIVGLSQAGVQGAATGLTAWLIVSSHANALRASFGDHRYLTIAFGANICLDLVAVSLGRWAWGWAYLLAAFVLGLVLAKMVIESGKALARRGVGGHPPRHQASNAANEAIQMTLRAAIPDLNDDVTLRAVAFELQSEGEFSGRINMSDRAIAAADAVALVDEMLRQNRADVEALIARHAHRLVDPTLIVDTIVPDVQRADPEASARLHGQATDLTEYAIHQVVKQLDLEPRAIRLCAAQCTVVAAKTKGMDSTFEIRERAMRAFFAKVIELGDHRSAVLALAAERSALR